jgi:hypothetical protein
MVAKGTGWRDGGIFKVLALGGGKVHLMPDEIEATEWHWIGRVGARGLGF